MHLRKRLRRFLNRSPAAHSRSELCELSTHGFWGEKGLSCLGAPAPSANGIVDYFCLVGLVSFKVGGFGSLPLASNSNHGRGALAPASVGGGLAALGRLNRLPPRPAAAPFGPSTPYRPAALGGALSRPSALRSAPLRSCFTSFVSKQISKIFSEFVTCSSGPDEISTY